MMHSTVLSAVLTMASLFACGMLSSVGTFCAVISCFGFGSTVQDFNTLQPPPPCAFLILHAPHLSICGLLLPPPSALFECMASMWCLHLPPWTPLQFELRQPETAWCINTASVHSMVHLSGSGMICRFALTAEHVDVEMCNNTPEQAVDRFPLLVLRLNNAWCNQGGKFLFTCNSL